MHRILLTLSFSIYFNISVFSCSCVGNTPFCEIIFSRDFEDSYIIKGRKVRTVNHGMDVKVLESYGRHINQDHIRIWGDLGWLCRSYISGFEDGDEFFMILEKLEVGTFHNPYEEYGENESHFSLSICGEHYLIINGDKVEGGISGIRDLEVIEYFLNAPDISYCDIVKVPITLMPNPAFSNTTLFSLLKFKAARIFNNMGQLMRSFPENDLQFLEFDVSELAPGIYFIEIVFTDQFSKIMKLVVI